MKIFCLEADVVNPSGRVYPKAVLEKAVADYTEEFVGGNRALGELGTPDGQVVNLKNVSHIVRGFHWEGDKLFADIEVLSTLSGAMVKSLLANGVKLRGSIRGLGSLVDSIVQDDYTISSIDVRLDDN